MVYRDYIELKQAQKPNAKPADHSVREGENETTSFEDEQPLNDPTDQAGSEPAAEMANGGTSKKSGTENDDSVTDRSDVEETPEEELGGKDEGVAAFVDERLIQSEGSSVPLNEIYENYERYVARNQFEKRQKSQFATSSRRILDFEIESERKRVAGSRTTLYLGVDLATE